MPIVKTALGSGRSGDPNILSARDAADISQSVANRYGLLILDHLLRDNHDIAGNLQNRRRGPGGVLYRRV